MPSPAGASRAAMLAAKAAASAPSSSSPPAPRISCKAPRARPPPGKTRSTAASPNGITPCAVVVGRSICRTRSRSVSKRSRGMLVKPQPCFLFVLLWLGCQLLPTEPPGRLIARFRLVNQPPTLTTRKPTPPAACSFIENTREVCHVVVVYSVGYRHLAAVQQLWLLWIPSIQLLYFVGPSGGIGLLVVLFIVFWLVIIFAGPWWGWYGWWW